MSNDVSLSISGTHFQLRCPHCYHLREELVNPALNKLPFSFNPNCSGCGAHLNPNMEFVISVQASLLHALKLQAKKTTQSEEASGGIRGGDKTAGSPVYPAKDKSFRADAELEG